MRITLCARSKILELLEPGSSFRIQSSSLPQAGQHVDLIPHSAKQPTDCIISHTPLVVADIETMTVMSDAVIDYDYNSQEFIISNRSNE